MEDEISWGGSNGGKFSQMIYEKEGIYYDGVHKKIGNVNVALRVPKDRLFQAKFAVKKSDLENIKENFNSYTDFLNALKNKYNSSK